MAAVGENPNSERVNPGQAPNCLKCRHFHVSWDPKFPRACSVFEIKSKRLPSHVVYEATGRHCPAFEKSSKIKEPPSDIQSPSSGTKI
jgi:hypothetical protein